MDKELVSQFMLLNCDKFPEDQLALLRTKLENSTTDGMLLTSAPLRHPGIALLLSFFGGTLGIDRFYIGDIGLGLLKLITAGGCGIWWFVDLFLIMGAAKRKNLNKILFRI